MSIITTQLPIDNPSEDIAIFSLAQLQQWMQGMLVHHVPVAGGGTEAIAARVEDVVNASQRLSASRHLDIYRYSYIARLRSCMQSQFQALAFALGHELFELFADQYLDAYPSHSYTLNTLGQQFAAFLEETRPDAQEAERESWPDFMIGLASFEYALSLIFDQPAYDMVTVATTDTADEQLRLTPVYRLFAHAFPICDYYLQFSQGKTPELPFPEPSFCIVTRRDYKLGLFSLKPAQYYFLVCMQRHNNVPDAKEELLQQQGYQQSEWERVWPEWKRYFVTSGFLVAGG